MNGGRSDTSAGSRPDPLSSASSVKSGCSHSRCRAPAGVLHIRRSASAQPLQPQDHLRVSALARSALFAWVPRSPAVGRPSARSLTRPFIHPLAAANQPAVHRPPCRQQQTLLTHDSPPGVRSLLTSRLAKSAAHSKRLQTNGVEFAAPSDLDKVCGHG